MASCSCKDVVKLSLKVFLVEARLESFGGHLPSVLAEGQVLHVVESEVKRRQVSFAPEGVVINCSEHHVFGEGSQKKILLAAYCFGHPVTLH